jgi:glycosyltransferase involved in cell wall biosynthesis
MQFVTAFNRDRDLYQVPLALHEGDLLAKLVTDLYLPDYLRGAKALDLLHLGHRYAPGLPSGNVTVSPASVLLQVLGPLFLRGSSHEGKLFSIVDRLLSRKSLEVARDTGSSFFTYSSYALEAFSDESMAKRRKVLFVYHPPSEGFMDILRDDLETYPEVSWSFAAHQAEMRDTDGERLRDEILLADELVCASTFTARTISKVKKDAEITVVPYGVVPIDGPIGKTFSRSDNRARFLFVGQGLQRKGLHHLLKVWKRVQCRNAELVLVCSRIDPAMQAAIAECADSVVLKEHLTRQQLAREFAAADVFVMPSLVEGFGLVFLEALAAGCFCIATPHTGLADLDLPDDVARIVPCGDIDELENAMLAAMQMVRDRDIDTERIRIAGAKRTWEDFREEIRAIACADIRWRESLPEARRRNFS